MPRAYRPNGMARVRFTKWIKRPFPARQEWTELRAPLFWAALSGILLRLAFPPIEWGWVAWFGMTPFLAQLPGRTFKQGAWLGFVFGASFFYLNLMWLNALASVNPLAPLGIVAMTLICAVAPVLFGGLVSWVSHRWSGLVFYLFTAALWTALEYVRSLSELGFPWVYLGHTQVRFLPLIQTADLAGLYGISLSLLLLNQFLADGWRCLRAGAVSRKTLAWEGSITFVLVVLLLSYGVWRLRLPETDEGGLRVALMQPGVRQEVKLASYDYRDPERAESTQSEIYAAVERQLKEIRLELESKNLALPDLYVLPESTVTHPYFNLAPGLVDMTEEWAETAGAPVFFGASRFEPPPGVTRTRDPRFFEEGRMYNSAYLAIPGQGLSRHIYDKMHLVPFGEYGSYLDVIPGFTEMILGIGNFEPGKGPQVFDVKNTRIGAVICFESCFPYLFRKYAKRNVDWMLVITNDAWYKLTSGARRHQTQSVFRAIETRRPVVRVANTGISCIIDAYGRVRAELPLKEDGPAWTIGTVPAAPADRTIYMRRWGEWLSCCCLLFSAVVAATRRKAGKVEKA